MKLRPVGSNQTELERTDGTILFFSYRTLVAVFVPGKGALCSAEKYSRTTSGHISKAVGRWGATRHDVPQETINQYQV